MEEAYLLEYILEELNEISKNLSDIQKELVSQPQAEPTAHTGKEGEQR